MSFCEGQFVWATAGERAHPFPGRILRYESINDMVKIDLILGKGNNEVVEVPKAAVISFFDDDELPDHYNKRKKLYRNEFKIAKEALSVAKEQRAALHAEKVANYERNLVLLESDSSSNEETHERQVRM